MRLQRVVSLLVPVAAAMLVSACSGIGDGSRPESLEIVRNPATVRLGTHSHKSFVCFPDQMVAILTQTNGDQGVFSDRVTWSSSNPEVALISNGDIPFPDDDTQVYARGVLMPQAAGTTTITAKFSNLSASYDVVVEAPESFTLTPADPALALFSSQQMKLEAKLGGYTRDVTAAVNWSFDEAATDDTTDEIATFNSGSAGLILVNKKVGTLTARAKLAACPENSASAQLAANLSSTVTVLPPVSITVARQFDNGDGTVDPIVVGNSEALTVTAHFDGTDKTQDVSGLSGTTAADATIAAGAINRIFGRADGSTTVKVQYPSFAVDGFTQLEATLPVTVITRTLQSIAIVPASPTMTALSSLQLQALATYQDGATQDVTRFVKWTTSDTKLETAGFQAQTAGLLLSLQAENAELTVTATSSKDSTKTATAPLVITALPN